jgi:hypothetical protein
LARIDSIIINDPWYHPLLTEFSKERKCKNSHGNKSKRIIVTKLIHQIGTSDVIKTNFLQ